jgi:hypothetical protein
MTIEELLNLNIEQISNRYQISAQSNDSFSEINRANTTMINAIQEINKVLSHISNNKEDIDLAIEQIEKEVEYNENQRYTELSIANKRAPKESKETDSERKAKAFIFARTDAIREKEDKLNKELIRYKNLERIWKHVQQTMYFMSERFSNSSYNIGAQIKAFGKNNNQVIIPKEEPIKTNTVNDTDDIF